MQVKTIAKTIAKKLEEWLETITDVDLRKAVKSNILVSGGSITSLFLNEKVNDYDIYIMKKKVLIDLVKYYTNAYEDVVVWDGADIPEMAKTIPTDNTQHAVAFRTLKPDQVKLFFKQDTQGGLRVTEDKKDEELNYAPKFFSPNAISLSNDVQIVIRFYGNAEEIHKTFDFIHATNYFTFADGLVTNKEALECILTKQLRYQGSLYPLTTIIRIKKFIKRNWNINAGEMLKVMFQISELNLKNPDVLEEQLIGVDVAYFSKLIEVLRGIDNPSMTSNYLNTIIDKVFSEADSNDEN